MEEQFTESLSRKQKSLNLKLVPNRSESVQGFDVEDADDDDDNLEQGPDYQAHFAAKQIRPENYLEKL